MIGRGGTASAPVRPLLYGCRPLGEGTPLIESLTGFLSRICARRNVRVRDVLDYLVRPLVPTGTLPPRPDLSWFLLRRAVWFDGMRPRFAPFVAALEQLTGLSQLSLHTSFPWARVFSPANSGFASSPSQRWCARCLEQWHREGVEPWEPLVWRSPVATYCPRHGVPLTERCPSCMRALPLLSDWVPIGFCHHCGHSLHRGDPNLSGTAPIDLHREDSARFEWWTSVALGQMLSVQRLAVADAEPAGFQRLIDRACSPPGPGIISVSRYLGVSYPTVLTWRRGEGHPPLRQFLSVCLKVGANPAQVALGPQYSFPTPWEEHAPDWRSDSMSGGPRFRVSEASRCRLRKALERAIDHGTFRSAREFGRAHNVSIQTVGRQFPDLYAILVERGAALREADRRAAAAQYQKVLDAHISGSDVCSVTSVARSLGIALDTLQCACPDSYARLQALYSERRKGVQRKRRACSRFSDRDGYAR